MSYLHSYLPYLFGNKKTHSFTFPQALDWGKLSFEEHLIFHALKGSLGEFLQTLTIKDLSELQVFHLFGFHEYLPKIFLEELVLAYFCEWKLFQDSTHRHKELDAHELQEILNFKNLKLSVFALLHSDRNRPGKLFVRRPNGSFVHKSDGSLWSIPVLGLSGKGLPFNHSNGCTPCGVYTLDSVMPEANRLFDFGKFRRLIVNFISKSQDEVVIKDLLPRAHHTKLWWSQCLVGRELGRSLLRIHGTGDVNKRPLSLHFPMVPTSGCLATVETNFFGLWKRNHQRELLDCLMSALSLPNTFENESKIHGVLYVIDFDGKFQALEFRE